MLRTDPGWSTTRGGSFRSFSALFEHFKMPILRHLWAEGGPTKMNGRTTPEPRTENTWETVLRVKRELRNTFCPSFFARIRSSELSAHPSQQLRDARDRSMHAPGTARLPRAPPPQSALTTAWARIRASLASCFACARAPCAAGSAHEAHGLVVLEPGEQAHERPRARAADPRAGEARGAKDRRTRGVRPRTRPQSTRAAR